MEAIRWQDEIKTLLLLDQTQLPGSEVWCSYSDYRQVAVAIKTMIVRGAPAIGVTAAYAYCLAALEHRALEDAAFWVNLRVAREILSDSRPTAVNLFWALERMERCLLKNGGSPQAISALLDEAKAIHREDVEMNHAIGHYGAAVVPHGARILTHCNAGSLATGGYGTALGVIRTAFTQGKVEMVYADETRPLLQGARLTAFELVQERIPATLIADNMAAALMAQGKIDLVVVGCDRMAQNGDFANKIGTYSVAVNAHYHGVPFYTALPSSTIDRALSNGTGIPIEDRPGVEMTHVCGVQTAPMDVGTYNPAFDVTPHTLLTGIITERGVIYPPFRENLARLFG